MVDGWFHSLEVSPEEASVELWRAAQKRGNSQWALKLDKLFTGGQVERRLCRKQSKLRGIEEFMWVCMATCERGQS